MSAKVNKPIKHSKWITVFPYLRDKWYLLRLVLQKDAGLYRPILLKTVTNCAKIEAKLPYLLGLRRISYSPGPMGNDS